VNCPIGASIAGFTLVGGAAFSGSALELTNGRIDEAGAARSATAIIVRNFATNINFQLATKAPNIADGMTCISNDLV
jgi:hypothetical protein